MTRQRIALFVRNGLIGTLAVNRALPIIKNLGYEPIIFNTGEVYSSKGNIPELRKIGFLETGLLKKVVEPLAYEYGTLTYANDYPIPNLNYTNKQLAELYGIDYEDVEDVNDSSFVKRIQDDKTIVGSNSIRILQIFHEPIINAFEEKDGGFIWNTHTGLLPKYKGLHSPFHALANNEQTYGWTIHRVVRPIDAGAIIATDWLPLDHKKPVLFTYLDMIPKGTEMFYTSLKAYKKYGTIKGRAQPVFMRDSYFSHPSNIQMRSLGNKGIRFCTEEEAIQTYLTNFTLAGTEHAQAMTYKLKAAIEEFKQNEFAPAA